MATVFLVLVVVLVVAGLVFGVVSLLSGDDPGISATDPDGRARPLPNNRSLSEFDLKDVRFDTGLRGYRMSQVDRVLRRTAYDLGYKDEMIAVLEAEVAALREGRKEDAELLRKAREGAANPPPSAPVATDEAPGEPPDDSVENFSRSAGTADAAEDDPEPATPAADLPREGSLRRRPQPPQPDAADADRSVGGDATDEGGRADAATADSDDAAPAEGDDAAPAEGDDTAPAHSDADNGTVHRPAKHG